MKPAARKSPQISMRLAMVLTMVVAVANAISLSGWSQSAHSPCDRTLSTGSCCYLCEALRPRWSARGTAVYMDRVTDGSLVLMHNTANPAEQLNANDFNYDWDVGFEVSLRRQSWNEHALEIRYLDLGQFDASTIAETNASILSINSTPPVFLPNVQSIAARSTSKVFSLEANYHYQIDDTLTLLAGFRYLSLDEDLTANLDAAPQTFFYGVSTRNDLYGGQIGVVAAKPLFGCLFATALAKAGVYGNDAAQRSLLDTSVANLGVHDSADSTAFVGELGISTELRICPRLSVFGGYRALWLESVAIASDQIPASDFFNGTGSDRRGGTVFHGATISLQLRL